MLTHGVRPPVPQRVEVHLHICALYVPDVARSKWRQLLVWLWQEAEFQLSLILLQGAHATIFGTAVIQEQISHFLEGLTLRSADVFVILLGVFILSFQRFRVLPRAANRVPVVPRGCLHSDLL